MKGTYPISYFKNPHVDKPIEEIWDDIDAYSGEFFEDEVDYHEKIDLMIPIPPMSYNGKFVKGVLFTQGAEYLLKLYPDLKKIFWVGAYTMWSSYSWCDKADLYFICYENQKREAYHKNKYKNKKDIIFLPLQDADYTNEYNMAPAFNTPKIIDVLCVATPYEVKNLPMVALTLKEYYKKYGKALKARFILGTKDIIKDKRGNLDYSKASKKSIAILDEIKNILGEELFKYVDFVPHVNYYKLKKHYTEARCTILASLIEGKNRAITESMACNTPIVVCKYHNQWARGEHPIFYENSGELAEDFTPEAYADAIYKILSNPENYEARKNYLKYNGRLNFINNTVKKIPYYKENIPDYEEGRFHDNVWVNLAVQNNYQMSYHDFVYGKKEEICWIQGLTRIDYSIKYYYSLFGVTLENNETIEKEKV